MPIMIRNFILFIKTSLFIMISFNPALCNENSSNYYIGSLQPYILFSFMPDSVYTKPKMKIPERIISLKEKIIFYDNNKSFPHDGKINTIEIQLKTSGNVKFHLNKKLIHQGFYNKGYNLIPNLFNSDIILYTKLIY